MKEGHDHATSFEDVMFIGSSSTEIREDGPKRVKPPCENCDCTDGTTALPFNPGPETGTTNVTSAVDSNAFAPA